MPSQPRRTKPQQKSFRTGKVFRLDRDGVGLIEDSETNRCYVFTVGMVKGFDGQRVTKLGVRNGKKVQFGLRAGDDRFIDWVDPN